VRDSETVSGASGGFCRPGEWATGPVPCLVSNRARLVPVRGLLHEPKHGTTVVPGWPEHVWPRVVSCP
jgi:hypothetical protein